MSSTLRTPYLAIAGRTQFLARAMLIVMLLGWVSWFFPFDDLLDRQGTPLGADFSMFYVAGQVISDGAAERLYDQAEHQRRLQRLFPGLSETFCLPYRYPPFVATLLAPLAWLPYVLAYSLFLSVSLAAWLATIWLLTDRQPQLEGAAREALGWAMVGWPVALETLIGGQASMVAAWIVAATLNLLRRSQPVAAGAVLALAAYKPNVLALFALGLLIRFPRMLLGAIPVAAVLGGVAHFAVGWDGTREYVGLLTRLASSPWDVETPFWKVHGLASWIGLVTPQHARVVTIVVGLASGVAIVVRWRKHDARDSQVFSQSAAGLVLVNLLFNPYTPIYDLVLLAPAILLGAECIRHAATSGRKITAGTIQLLLAAIFFGPHLSQMLTIATGVQMFPLLLLGVALWFARFCGRGVSATGRAFVAGQS